MIPFQVETLFRQSFKLSARNCTVPDTQGSLAWRGLLLVISTIALILSLLWLLAFVS